MVSLDELKGKKSLTRSDIAALLASIGKPGEKRDKKLEVIRELHQKNHQGYDIEVTLDGYQEF